MTITAVIFETSIGRGSRREVKIISTKTKYGGVVGGVFVILFACITGPAAATTITFESLAQPGTGANTFTGSYTEAGFQFVNDVAPFDFGNWRTGDANFPGSTALFNDRQTGITTLTLVGGGEFAMVSIDLAAFVINSPSQSLTFTGTLPNNSTVTQTFLVPASGSTITETTFVFSPGFADVKSVAFAPQNDPDYQFDNVTVNIVPEASTISLCLCAAAAAFGLKFRRRAR